MLKRKIQRLLEALRIRFTNSGKIWVDEFMSDVMWDRKKRKVRLSRLYIGPKNGDTPRKVEVFSVGKSATFLRVPESLRCSASFCIGGSRGSVSDSLISSRFSIGQASREHLCRAYWDFDRGCQCLCVPYEAQDYILWYEDSPRKLTLF